MPAESAPPNPPAWWNTRTAGHAALLCLVLGAAGLLGAVVQAQFGIFGDREWPLPAAAKIRSDGKACKTKLPDWGHGALAERRVVLLRDGKPVGMRVNHAKTVVERGGGAFKIQREQIYFSLPKDEDPRPNARSLSLSLPRPVKPAVWIAGGMLLVFGGFIARRNAPALHLLATARSRLGAVPAAALVSTVFIIALVVTLARLPEAMVFSDGSFSVKGVPYSDASGWDELATNLAEGRGFSGGFSAQRPLYPAMLGLLYTVTGQSLLAAKALNAFWLALAAAAVCALGIAGGSRLAGLAGALGVLIGEDYTSFSKLLLTETAGVAFGAAAVLALAVAIGSPKWWRIAFASLLLACANLAGGFGLFALLGYGAVALTAWWVQHGMRRALMQSLVLAGVVALAWMPWLLRQHAVHGIWNLSTSSANLMFAAAQPDHGKWGVEVASAWQSAGVPDEEGARYRFYMGKYAEAVKDHPVAYAKNILAGMETFADFWVFEGPDHSGIVLLGLIGVAVMTLRRRWWPALAASAPVIALCFALQGQTAKAVWPVAAALTLLTCTRQQRPLWALVVVTTPFVAVLAGMTGGTLGRRMWTACEWTMPLLLVMGGAGAMRVLRDWFEMVGRRLNPSSRHLKAAPMPDESTESRLPGKMSLVTGLVLLAHVALAGVVTTGLHLVTADDPRSSPGLPTDVRLRAHALATAQFDFLKTVAADDERLWTAPCEFGEYVCELTAGEDAQHWARSFEVRAYARSVAFAKLLPGSGLVACQLRAQPREIPRDAPLLLIGMRNHDANAHLGHDTTMVEVLGWVPLGSGGPDWPRAVWLPFTPESLDIAQRR